MGLGIGGWGLKRQHRHLVSRGLGLPDMDCRGARGCQKRAGGRPPSGGAQKGRISAFVKRCTPGSLCEGSIETRRGSRAGGGRRSRATTYRSAGAPFIDPDRQRPAAIRQATLMVGTDCCVGKSIPPSRHKALVARWSLRSGPRPDWHHDCGRGIPMDAVVSDFLSGRRDALTRCGAGSLGRD
ncbi:MAG: hypothetical protein CM15mP103_02560 [Gammaproteobacteria bacterium]|nr:MAG: hypothetical protein CM15mP103_02560 [Gammaproteobacteria bacterium]